MTNFGREGGYEGIMSLSDEEYQAMSENEPPVKVESRAAG
jgi:hypothetical protein